MFGNLKLSGLIKTSVCIKPDNFKFPNIRPGGVIEIFSRTGLYIVGFKVHRMSVAEAENFYGRCFRYYRKNSDTPRAAMRGKTLSNSWPGHARATLSRKSEMSP